MPGYQPYQSDLTDEEGVILEPLITPGKRAGDPHSSDAGSLDGVLGEDFRRRLPGMTANALSAMPAAA